MKKWKYKAGLCDLGSGCHAYLQPKGDWGWSNAGLVTDSGESLLIDTLFDLKLTEKMLKTMRRSVEAAKKIGTVVNTHANGDHYFGNQLVADATIIASKKAADEMESNGPVRLLQLIDAAQGHGVAGRYLKHCFGAFDFSRIKITPPSKTFSRKLKIQVGTKEILLKEVGPAHTGGDILVHCPQEKILFTGDIVFVDVTPIMWAGPVSNWIEACETIIGLDIETVIPGHGPLTDKSGPQKVLNYLIYIRDEALKRFQAGLSVEEAAFDISLSDFSSWFDSERIAVNVNTLYREFNQDQSPLNVDQLFEFMARVKKTRRL